MNFFLIFLTGLTTGGLSCLAVQGGLLASVISNKEDYAQDAVQQPSRSLDRVLGEHWQAVLAFLLAKLIAYTILGFFLGMLGSAIALSLEARLFFQVIAALFMFATAMNLLNVHPIFRYAVLQPPKFVQRLVRNSTKSKALFGPAFLGLMTVLIPCGVTQAMELLAINSGNPVLGAVTMFAFVLGTSPLFAILGIATAKMGELWNMRFLQFAAIALIFMAVYSINGVLTVMDAPLTAQKVFQKVSSFGEPPAWYGNTSTTSVPIVDGVQKMTIEISSSGYSPTKFTVKAGIPVVLTLSTNNAYSCASSFTFKKFKIFEQLQPTGTKTVTFTPKEKGSFTYACSMGMYQGVMEVI